MNETAARPIRVIAAEIWCLWKNPSPSAKPYMDAMTQINLITDNYYADTAYEVVARFLSNATYWRGEDAKRLKAELKAIAGIK